MPNAVYFNSYKLKEGASVPDFLHALDELTNEIASKHKGFISFRLHVDGETWADYAVFETMDDLDAFLISSKAAKENGTNDLAERFYSFCDFAGCTSHKFTIEMRKEFTRPKD